MGRIHHPSSISILNMMRERGSANYLEIEQALGIAHGLSRISHLRADGYIYALPKDRGQLKRYALTPAGRSLIGLHLQEQANSARCVMKLPRYVPQAFTPARAGAMRAFSLPSRGIGA